MLTGILLILIVALIGVLSHRRSRLENKIYRNVPLADWLYLLILPIIFYLGWFFVAKNILERPPQGFFPLDDFDVLAITILFVIFGFMGNGMHFTSKILWRYLQKQNKSMVYKVNEMFHGKLSHYLIYLNGLCILFLLPILEINHPVPVDVTGRYLLLSAITGVILGYTCSKAIFYTNEWFGGYNKPLFFVTSVLLILIFGLNRLYSMNYSFYPVNFFVIFMGTSFNCAFIVRQLIIFSKLGTKRRFRFLAKIFSA